MNKFFQELKKEHKEVQDILDRLTGMKSGSSSKMDDLFQKLKVEIVPHMKAEEKVFYPSLEKKSGEAREHALEGFEEHHVAELVLSELDQMDMSEDHWAPKMKVLKELIEHHVQEEESEIFESAEKVLKSNDFDMILSQFEEEKQRIKQSMA
ncbi:MAG: hemerythrin domain-containing protein [Syntrophorhabdaceae bacterium]